MSNDKIVLRQVSREGNKDIIVHHGDYKAVLGKLFNDLLTLPHPPYICQWCGYVNSRYTFRTDWTLPVPLKVGDHVIATGRSWSGDDFAIPAKITAESGENMILFEYQDKDGVSQGTWVQWIHGSWNSRVGDFWVRLDPYPRSIELILDLAKE